LRNLLLFLICINLNSCFLFDKKPPVEPIIKEEQLPSFNANPQEFVTSQGKTDEASGMVASRNTPNSLWIIEDSNNMPGLHLIGNDGTYKRFISFPGKNRDWEDLAIGPGPEADLNYIYLPDIGDNFDKYGSYQIYRFPEPTANQTDIKNFDTFTFTYPGNKSYNAETLMIDPKTKDLYIITKNEANVKVFRLKYPQVTLVSTEAEYMGDIPYGGLITAGDISPKGDEILLKNYFAVYYWKIKKDETIYSTLKRLRDIGAPYFAENQGESICWDNNAKGYYTISEKVNLEDFPKLYYYSKK
jgi:hypothetical protein